MNTNIKQMTIGVFFGSRSPEHEVSIITGQFIISELKKLGYRVIPVYIDKKGQWFSEEILGSLKFFTDIDLENKLNKFKPCLIDINAKNNKLILKSKGLYANEKLIDLAFPALHGLNGEDGTIQGLFELCNIPYVGCGVASSAMTMDKIITKQTYKNEGILATPFLFFSNNDWLKNKKQMIDKIKKLQWPIFIKPSKLGSSIGIAKVNSEEDLESACEVAFHYDDRIIVEESVEDMIDITCAVIGDENPAPSLVQESIFQGGHFSYEAKYLEDGGAQLGNAQKNIVIPARLNEKTTQEVQDLAIKIFKLFNCNGIARIDFIYDKKNERIYANEVNTMPGTLYHHLWKESGVETNELLENLIKLAINRHDKNNKLTTTFKSDILSQANSIKLQIKKRAD